MTVLSILKEVVFDSEAGWGKDHNQAAKDNHHVANIDSWEAFTAVLDGKPREAFERGAMATINRAQGFGHRALAAVDHFVGRS